MNFRDVIITSKPRVSQRLGKINHHLFLQNSFQNFWFFRILTYNFLLLWNSNTITEVLTIIYSYQNWTLNVKKKK